MHVEYENIYKALMKVMRLSEEDLKYQVCDKCHTASACCKVHAIEGQDTDYCSICNELNDVVACNIMGIYEEYNISGVVIALLDLPRTSRGFGNRANEKNKVNSNGFKNRKEDVLVILEKTINEYITIENSSLEQTVFGKQLMDFLSGHAKRSLNGHFTNAYLKDMILTISSWLGEEWQGDETGPCFYDFVYELICKYKFVAPQFIKAQAQYND